ncbi:MAG: ABC transporter ATP-binding protein/permease [Gammaproteobacteria bacterium]|jgi:ABC-type transport system involved in Fe-S cluster assembly fused permease/ATPase subunit|nr:ABC transporter ATP-binding protein/permease [Gammaproteobacteria bacterium]MBP6481501.1 ABC transporter ATP-binding protein/permease [Pseudomonadales bacterium]MBP7911512.1 ABC transporter ATP-binding protein/permease [Pseudomonadales bacterium]
MRSSHSASHEATGFSWRAIRMIWPYLAQYRARIALALGCLVLAKLGSIWAPFLLKHAVDTMGAGGAAWLKAALGLVAAYGAARFANVMFGEIRDTLFGRVTERAMRRVGLRVFEHLHGLDLDFHLERRTGGLARDIERGTNGISFLMRFFVFNIAPTLFEILVVAALLAWNYGIAYAAITLVAVLAYIAFSIVATEWRTTYVRAANLADSASNTLAVDSLLNYETVKYFGNEAHEAARYDAELGRWEEARRKNRLTLFALNAGQALIVALAMTASMALAARDVSRAQMSVGDFVLINAFMMQLFMPLNFLGMVYREIKGSLAAIEEMFGLLAVRPRVADRPGARPLAVSGARVEFRDVAFRYQAEREILRGVNLRIEPGTKLAVVGASGSGKSTLVKLLFRFHDASEGAILIDGQDIRDVTQQSLRAAIGIVPQDTVLFNDTLLENIRFGRPGASDADVQQAVRMAHLADFVAQLPLGLATRVGERGLKLSGGERQRVAIARTILKRPPILVFDEATSSLDSKAERLILEALAEIAHGHTSLVIAHRLSTVVDADCIAVLDDGRVIEQGRHEELLAAGGAYAALWRNQQT